MKRHRGKVRSIEQFNWEIPEDKLEKALEFSYDELYKFKLEEDKEKKEVEINAKRKSESKDYSDRF